MHVRPALLALALSGALAVMGCGDDGSDDGGSGGTPTTATSGSTSGGGTTAPGSASGGPATTPTTSGGATTTGATAGSGSGSTKLRHTGEPSSGPAEDRAAAKAVVRRYITSLVAGDYAAVCATREPAERRELADSLGSCEAAFRKIAESQPLSLLQDAEYGNVRIRGNLAGVDFSVADGAAIDSTLSARRTGGRWRVVDIPDEQAP